MGVLVHSRSEARSYYWLKGHREEDWCRFWTKAFVQNEYAIYTKLLYCKYKTHLGITAHNELFFWWQRKIFLFHFPQQRLKCDMRPSRWRSNMHEWRTLTPLTLCATLSRHIFKCIIIMMHRMNEWNYTITNHNDMFLADRRYYYWHFPAPFLVLSENIIIIIYWL